MRGIKTKEKATQPIFRQPSCVRLRSANRTYELRAEAVKIHEISRGSAGARTISGQLKNQGEAVGRYMARSLMKEAGLVSTQFRKHHYKTTGEESVVAPNHLNREFSVTGPNQVWCGDVTYIWAGTQWIYLAVVLDLYARRVVGWAMSTSPDSRLTMQALTVAHESRGRPAGVMFHSDQGCHYTSLAYRQKLWQYAVFIDDWFADMFRVQEIYPAIVLLVLEQPPLSCRS